MSAPIGLPSPPAPPQRRDFPLLASAAPVAGSVIMWAITGSPFSLVFAALGPLIAGASLLDARRNGRARRREDETRFTAAVAAARLQLRAAQDAERIRLRAAAPDAPQLLGGRSPTRNRWRGTLREPVPISLGTGVIAHPVVLSPDRADHDEPRELTELRHAAARLPDAPVIVDAREGIGVCGPALLTEAFTRAVLVQLADRLAPQHVRLTHSGGPPFDCLTVSPFQAAAEPLPGPATPTARTLWLTGAATNDQHQPATDGILVALAETEHDLPSRCRIIVRLGGEQAYDGGGATVHGIGAGAVHCQPHYATTHETTVYLRRAYQEALAEGVIGARDELPEALPWTALPQHDTGELPAVFFADGSGPVPVDLVSDGPHAIVGGTTGSGKSELLISWVLAMAATRSPEEVTFLLADFKGGSSFGLIETLPHTVGLITDLDQRVAERALRSLRAELRHREGVLAAHGARAITDLPRGVLPRLVIVVDEFAVVMTDHPELHTLFADLAARGRSLGVHLILCTQRPAGVVRDSVLANCTLRLSLRVNNIDDSRTLLGTAVAAELPRRPAGRCVVATGDGDPVIVQIALADQSDAAAVAAHWPRRPVRRPWRDPLPATLDAAELPSAPAGLLLGLADVPEEQAQLAAWYDPAGDGNLMVVGGRGSGKSVLLGRLAAGAGDRRIVVLTGGIEQAWDEVQAIAARCDGAARAEGDGRPEGADFDHGQTLCLIDDLDSMLGRFGDEHAIAFTETLGRLLRDGPAAGIHVVATTARLGGALATLATRFDSRLLLRLPSREEHLLCGGVAAEFDPQLPPGGAWWRGHRIQVAVAGPLSPTASPPPAAFELRGCAVVTSRPRQLAERLRADGQAVTELTGRAFGELQISSDPAVLVGDPAAWQNQWALLAAARGSMPILFDGCTLAELRALLGNRALPPPLDGTAGRALLLTPDDAWERVRLPALLQKSP